MGLEARGAWLSGLPAWRSGGDAGGEHLGYLEDFVGRGFLRRCSGLGGRRCSPWRFYCDGDWEAVSGGIG
jgi:hypothetical protein